MDGETKQEFAEVRTQFKKIDDQFKKVDQRFAKMDQRFEKMSQEMSTQFKKVDQRFDKMDKRFDKIMNFLYTKVALAADLESLATKDELYGVKDKMLTKMDEIVGYQKKFDQELPGINLHLERLDRKPGILPPVQSAAA
jgi:hypothetical protein